MPDSPKLSSSNQEDATNATSPDSTTLSNLNRDSAIVLGVLLFLIFVAISWYATRRIRAHTTALWDADAPRLSVAVSTNHSLSESNRVGRQFANGITGYRVFKVQRDISREEFAGRQDGSMSTLPRYEDRGSVGALSERERQRNWWGSVAAHGTTTRADTELPPLPPSPALKRLAHPAAVRGLTVDGFRNDSWHDE